MTAKLSSSPLPADRPRADSDARTRYRRRDCDRRRLPPAPASSRADAASQFLGDQRLRRREMIAINGTFTGRSEMSFGLLLCDVQLDHRLYLTPLPA